MTSTKTKLTYESYLKTPDDERDTSFWTGSCWLWSQRRLRLISTSWVISTLQ